MREIKFRGKDIKSDMWAYGDLHTLCDMPYIDTEESAYPFAGKRSFINPDTIGQYTGLNDKNGDEIYEGDIVGCTLLDEKERIGAVQYHNGCFWFICTNGFSDEYLVNMCDKEVIGNVYDNPELLKKN